LDVEISLILCYALGRKSMPVEKGKPAVMLGRKATVPHKRAPNHQIDLGANFKREAALPKRLRFTLRKVS